jgi:N-acetyltransferase
VILTIAAFSQRSTAFRVRGSGPLFRCYELVAMQSSAIAQPTLSGHEVVLRPLVAQDVQGLAVAAAEDRKNYRFNPVPNGPAEAEAYIARALQQQSEGERMPFAILWKERVVGTTSYSEIRPWQWPEGSTLQRHGRPDVVEIGFTWLAASAQRTRCNTEAKYLLLRHAFEVWDVHRVAFRTDVRNETSRAAIERLGAKLEGIRRADKPGRDGKVRDSIFFSIVRAEWPAVGAALERRLA